MKRAIITFAAAAVAFVLGVGCTYFLMRTPPPQPDNWITITSAESPFSYKTDVVFEQDFKFPTTHKPSGQVKFIRGENGIQLGYKLSLPVDAAPTAEFPEPYRRTKKLPNGFSEGPPEQLQLTGQFEFTLEDSDGFVVAKVSGPTEYVSANSKNTVQSVVVQPISQSIVDRTKKIEVSFSADDCNPCKPHLYD